MTPRSLRIEYQGLAAKTYWAGFVAGACAIGVLALMLSVYLHVFARG